MFKKGQKVWDVMFGPGEVSEILTNGASVPVIVRFDDAQVVYFALDGKHLAYAMQTLFPYPVEIVKKVTKPSIDWSHVKEDYKWLSVNANGSANVYENEPKVGVCGYWYNPKGGSDKVNVLASYVPGTCDWNDSLVKRPQLNIRSNAMFVVGQKVFCKVHGEGVVTKVVDIHRTFPVEVDFLNGEWEFYTKDGRQCSDGIEPSLSVIEE